MNPAPDNDRRGTSGRIAALAAVLLIVALYFGIASENRRAYASRPVTYNYYDLLAEGFMSGHLYLNLPLEPEKMLPGSDPMKYTPRDHDLSLYEGRYYLYFGAAPAVALFLPWEVLTGHELSQYWAGAFLAAAGYVFSAILLFRIRRDFFPRVSPGVFFCTLLLLGLVNWWPILLNRVGVWEVAISGAFCFSCLTILCIYEGIRDGGRLGCLALASLSAGLAVASRPNYLFVTTVLAVPLVYFLKAEGSSPAAARKWTGRICATLGPVACVGVLLGLYNYRRFGDPIEFGTGFMILVKPNPVHFFSIRSAVFNFYLYFLAPAHFSPWFPFFNITRVPALPPGHTDIPEDMYGSLANVPILLAAAIGACLAVTRGALSRLNAVAISLLLGFIVGGGTLVIFVGANNRYIPDVLCGLPVLAVLGIWVVEQRVGAGTLPRRRSRFVWGLLAAYSAFFAFCAGIQRDEIFRQACPEVYRGLAHAFNYPSQWYDRIRGVTYGPVKLDVTFPSAKPGQNEPLVVTGWGPWSNMVYVRYVDTTHLQFAFIGPRGVVRSDPFELDYGRDHHLVISMGGLYPPREHPFFDGIDPADADALSNTVFASVDGVTRLHAREPSFDGVSRRPELGVPPSVLDPHWTFTGTIIRE